MCFLHDLALQEIKFCSPYVHIAGEREKIWAKLCNVMQLMDFQLEQVLLSSTSIEINPFWFRLRNERKKFVFWLENFRHRREH